MFERFLEPHDSILTMIKNLDKLQAELEQNQRELLELAANAAIQNCGIVLYADSDGQLVKKISKLVPAGQCYLFTVKEW